MDDISDACRAGFSLTSISDVTPSSDHAPHVAAELHIGIWQADRLNAVGPRDSCGQLH